MLAEGHEGYRHLTELRVGFGDLDAMGHLNNVALLRLLETSRVDYVVDLGLGRHDELTFVIASLHCDFRAQAHYRDVLTCGTRAAARGRSSLVLDHTVWKQDHTTVATAEAALVTLDEDSTSPAPLPHAWVPAIEEYEGVPLPAKGRTTGSPAALAALFPLETGAPVSDARVEEAQRLLAREIELMASFADRRGPPPGPFSPFDPSWS